MTGIITLTVAGTDTGPFDIYSDADGYVIPFGTNITKSVLIAGWATDAIPLGTVSIRVQSVSANCSNYVDISAIFVDPNLTLVYNDYSAMEFPEDLAFWNEYFGIDGSPEAFTAYQVVGESVILSSPGGITLQSNQFVQFPGDPNATNLLEVLDPSGLVVSIEEEVFSNPIDGVFCQALTKVIFSGVVTIGQAAFYNCTSLVTTDFSSLITASEAVFNGCISLLGFDAPLATDFGNYCFYECESIITVTAPNLITAGDSCFSYTILSTYYDFPLLTTVGDNCFFMFYDTELVTINLPLATSIGDYCFYNCFEATTIYIPLVTVLGNGVFSGCSLLAEISCVNVVTIGDSVFSGTNLTEVILNSLTSMGTSCFGISSLVTISLPLITDVPQYSFQCPGTSVNLPLVTSIGKSSCTFKEVLTLSLPNLITAGELAFTNCKLMTTLNTPLLETLGNNAFAQCYELATLSLPSLTSIGTFLFYTNFAVPGFAKLTSIDFPLLAHLPAGTFWSGAPYTGGNELTYLNIPVCTSIGTSPSTLDQVFNFSGKTTTVIIDPVLRTNNVGALDAHLQYLVDNNTVTLIDA